MSVRLDKGEVPEGHVAVEGHFFPLNAMRVELVQPNGEFVVYLALMDVQPADDPVGAVLRELSNAKTVNLWYQAHATGLTLVDDTESVRDLEECLVHYEEHRKATMQ